MKRCKADASRRRVHYAHYAVACTLVSDIYIYIYSIRIIRDGFSIYSTEIGLFDINRIYRRVRVREKEQRSSAMRGEGARFKNVGQWPRNHATDTKHSTAHQRERKREREGGRV